MDSRRATHFYFLATACIMGPESIFRNEVKQLHVYVYMHVGISYMKRTIIFVSNSAYDLPRSFYDLHFQLSFLLATIGTLLPLLNQCEQPVRPPSWQ